MFQLLNLNKSNATMILVLKNTKGNYFIRITTLFTFIILELILESCYSIYYPLIIFNSMTELSKQQLLKALTQPNNYKLAKPFLQQVLAGNMKIIGPINAVFASVIKSNKVSLIGKLQTIRFFKEIFETGNMNIIDQLNEEIEDHLVAVAGFNKASKEITRGANYFIEVQKRNASVKDIKQMGTSYVILATQIIKKLSEWYPVDQSNEKTRFMEYFQFLKKSGVSFPATESYFKPADTQKFQTNYKMWLQNQVKKKVKEPQEKNLQSKVAVQNKQNQPQKSEGKQQINKPSNENKQKMKSQAIAQKKVLQNRVQQGPASNQPQKQAKIEQKIQLSNQNKVQEKIGSDTTKSFEAQKATIVQKLQQTQEKLLNVTKDNEALRKNMQQFQAKNKKLEQQMNGLHKLVESMKKTNSTQNDQNKKQQLWKAQQNKFLGEIKEKENKFTQLEAKYNEFLKQSSKNADDKLAQLHKKNQQLRTLQQTKNSILQMVDKYKNQLQSVTEEKEASQKIIEQQKMQLNSLTKKFQQVQHQNINLKQKCQNLIKQKNQAIKICIQRPQQIQIVDKKTSQSKLNASKSIQKASQEPQFILQQQDHVQEKSTEDLFKMSMSKFLQTQKIQVNNPQGTNQRNNHLNSLGRQSKNEQRKSKSIGKTENSLNRVRQRIQQTQSSNFNRTDSLWGSASFGVQLKKTGVQKFRKKEQARIISTLPFIEQYFNPINLNESFTFRSLCLMRQSAQSSPIMSNDNIEIRLINASKTLIISVKNRTQHQQEILISSQHPEVKICGQNTAKIVQPGMYTDFSIDARITNLNTRFPVCELQVSSSTSLVYGFPLPISLYTFCRFTELEESQRLNQLELKCYKSQKFVINKLYRSIETCFESLKFTTFGDRKQWFGKISYKYLPEISLFMRIQQYKRNCTIQLDFDPESTINDAFAKVLLQNLMFLLM